MSKHNEVTYTGFFKDAVMINGFGGMCPSGKITWYSVPCTENKSTPEEARRAAEEFAHGKSVRVARCSWEKTGENASRQVRTWIE